jgi:hypothetical protein
LTQFTVSFEEALEQILIEEKDAELFSTSPVRRHKQAIRSSMMEKGGEKGVVSIMERFIGS